MFIKDKLVALNNTINNVSSRVSSNSNNITNLQNTTNNIKSTVNDLDSDSLWKKMTLSSNFNGSNDYCAYRQVGKLVEIRFVVTPKTNYPASSTNLLLAYGLPENCQPATWSVRGVAFHNGKAYRIEVPIKTNANGGKIYIARNANGLSSGYLITGQIMFIRGVLLNILNMLSSRMEVCIC